jgi:DNA-binding beta-propeller fold protein YncE/mono/diheme cytochrome c family protein
LSGSTIAAIGERAVTIDADSGKLVLSSPEGNVLDTMALRSNAGHLAADRARGLVYVADRDADRLWVVKIKGERLVHERRVATPAEPFGVALTPDGKTVLVTTIADRKLVGYATDTMRQMWSIDIPAEARGIAVRPDGAEALITHLTTGTVTHVTFAGRPHSKAPAIRHTALNRPGAATNNQHPRFGTQTVPTAGDDAGFTFARNSFAATHLPNGTAIIAYQTSTPKQVTNGRENVGSYGGGVQAPIEHRIAFVGKDGSLSRPVARAQISAHQPRALAYDPGRDILYIAGLGNDRITAIASAADAGRYHAYTVGFPAGKSRCGATGMDVTDSGEVLVFCSFRRAIAKVTTNENLRTAKIDMSKELTRSKMSRAAHRGMQLFHTGGDFRLSSRGAMACASCHPEGRTDGLSWRIEGHSLQTPLLIGGRLMGTHPFKWDGKDRNIMTSLTNTVKRLGGTGIKLSDAKDLQAFFATLPRPRSKTVADHRAVKRGKKLFRSKTLGCASCHSGAKYTDGKSYDLADDLGKVDTPSLIGLAASAPYYHDGSAADLRALIMEKGSVHGMGRLDRIEGEQIDDLIAFLETL